MFFLISLAACALFWLAYLGLHYATLDVTSGMLLSLAGLMGILAILASFAAFMGLIIFIVASSQGY